jgi:hypothetical protein
VEFLSQRVHPQSPPVLLDAPLEVARPHVPLSANMNETPPPPEFNVEGEQGRYDGPDPQHPSRP